MDAKYCIPSSEAGRSMFKKIYDSQEPVAHLTIDEAEAFKDMHGIVTDSKPSELLVHCLFMAVIALCGYIAFGVAMLIDWLI